MISIDIDGKEIKTEEKRTIIEVARENGIYIPTLCYHERLFPIGSCRLCIVEIEGFEKPQTACTTPVVDGMRIVTKSERLFEMRREFLKFILMEHPLDCPQCDKAGKCKLQDLVYEHRIDKADYKITAKKDRIEPFSTPLIRKWPKRCVLCLRCYHACKEISGQGVFQIEGGGLGSKIGIYKAEECISCGECLGVCPVGALTENLSPLKTRPWMAEKDVITTCPHCGFGCAFSLVSQNGYISKIETEERMGPNMGSLCVRGRFGYDFAMSELRIKEPFVRIYDEKRTLSMEEAQRELINNLKEIEEEGGAIGFIVSPRITNEEASLIHELGRIFKKAYFSSSSYFFPYKLLKAYKNAGLPYGYDLDDLARCDLIFTTGSELLSDNHVFSVKIREAIKRKGVKIVTIDQYEGPLSAYAIKSLKVRTFCEGLLFDLVASYLIKEEGVRSGIRNYDEYRKSILNLEEKTVLDLCGIGEEDFKDILKLIKGSKRMGIVFGSAIGEAGIAKLINFSLLSGALLFPVVEQANGVGVSAIFNEMVDPLKIFTDEEIRGILIFDEEPSQYLSSDVIEKASKSKYIVHFAFLPTEITNLANLVIPVSGFHEREGTYFSGSGKIGRVRKIKSHIDSISILRGLLLKLNCTWAKNEVTGQIEDYLRGEGVEKSYLLIDHEEYPKKGVIMASFRDTFKNPYLRYSKGMKMVESDKVYISRKDAEALNLKEGEEVKVESKNGSIMAKISINDRMAEGVLLFKPHFDFSFTKLFEQLDKPLEVKVEKG